MELSLKWDYGVKAFLHDVFFIWENMKTKLEVFLTFQKMNLVYIWDVTFQKNYEWCNYLDLYI